VEGESSATGVGMRLPYTCAVSVETIFLGMSHLLPTKIMLGLLTTLDDDEP
jgi:hypothetical protein